MGIVIAQSLAAARTCVAIDDIQIQNNAVYI